MFVPPITLTYDDGTAVEVAPKPIDVMLVEREFGTDVTGRQVESTMHMAWSALRRDGEARPFEVWAAAVADIKFAETAVDPTQAAASTDSPPN